MHLKHTFSHLHKLINCFLWRLYTYFIPILKYPSIKCRTQFNIHFHSEELLIGSVCFYIIAELIYYGFHVFVFTFQRHGCRFSAEHFKCLSYKVFQHKVFRACTGNAFRKGYIRYPVYLENRYVLMLFTVTYKRFLLCSSSW